MWSAAIPMVVEAIITLAGKGLVFAIVQTLVVMEFVAEKMKFVIMKENVAKETKKLAWKMASTYMELQETGINLVV